MSQIAHKYTYKIEIQSYRIEFIPKWFQSNQVKREYIKMLQSEHNYNNNNNILQKWEYIPDGLGKGHGIAYGGCGRCRQEPPPLPYLSSSQFLLLLFALIIISYHQKQTSILARTLHLDLEI